MKKLCIEAVHARLNAYEEAFMHLEETLGDYYFPEGHDRHDVEQTKFVIEQIKKIANKFQHKHFPISDALPHNCGTLAEHRLGVFAGDAVLI